MKTPLGALFTLGLWLDRPAGLLAVADVLVAGGATYTGEFVEGEPGQLFAWKSDLVTRRGGAEGLPAAEVRRRAAGGRAYGLDLEVPGAGPTTVEFEATPDGPEPPERHPVLVTMAADCWGIPRFAWDRDIRRRARAHQRVVLRQLRALCTTLDPAYAVLGVESLIPTPAALAAGAPFGGDVYFSARFPVGPVAAPASLEWVTGVFHSHWFLAEGPSTLAAVAKDFGARLSTGAGRVGR
ncbi:hypothetical protein ACFFWC_22530 [Plantactinospora siamensis]|uniref:Uncharacterized protein n=1 Tax=Plantactinospora siamensis TaxID=555372 RepID=A0ABV6NYH2_9ACTN